MKIVNKRSNMSTLCIGCLSENRILIPITRKEEQTLYFSLLDTVTSNNDSMLVCFECKALINKLYKFKIQVNNANRALESCLIKYEKPIPLSNLKQTEIKITNKYTDSINDDFPNNGIFILDNGNRLMDNEFTDSTHVNVKTEHLKLEAKLFNDKLAEDDNGNQSNGVKMETNEIESVFVDEDNVMDNYDVVNEEFNDSDEEPLLRKKTKRRKKHKKPPSDPSPPAAPYRVKHSARTEHKLKEMNVDTSLVQMVILSAEEVMSQRARALSAASFAASRYRCERCVVSFNHSAKLEMHMKKHAEEAGDIMCDICEIRFKSDKALYGHKRRHRVRWRCVLCGFLSSRAGVCADHVARHSTRHAQHACGVCGERLQSLTKLKIHKRVHSEPVSCEVCGNTYRDRDALRTHMFKHNAQKEFECPQCEKKFLYKKNLELHELSHAESQNLYCHECDVSFKNSTTYYSHMKYNLKHIDPARLKHSCATCGRSFAQASRLAEHERARHTHEAPVACDHPGCDKSFPSRSALRSHRSLVHRQRRLERPHVCHRCGQRYKSKCSLSIHLRSHLRARLTREEVKVGDL